MRMSQYVAPSFFASASATAPSFSSAGSGLVAFGSGSPKSSWANSSEAAVVAEPARKARRLKRAAKSVGLIRTSRLCVEAMDLRRARSVLVSHGRTAERAFEQAGRETRRDAGLQTPDGSWVLTFRCYDDTRHRRDSNHAGLVVPTTAP